MSFIIAMVPVSFDNDIKKFTFCLLGSIVVLAGTFTVDCRQQKRHADRVLPYCLYRSVSQIKPGQISS